LEEEAEVLLQVTHKYDGATDIAKNYPVRTGSQSVRELLNWALGRMSDEAQQQQRAQQPEAERVDGDGDAVPDAVRSVATEWGIANLVPPPHVTMRGTLDTTHGRYVLTVPPQASSSLSASSGATSRKRTPSLQHFPAATGPAPTATSAILEHDRPRNRRVDIEDEFWKLVGVTTPTTSRASSAAVAVKPDMIAKVRQCEKFVEIVSNLVREVTAAPTTSGTAVNGGDASPSAHPDVRITDLGCGKGYLTYALHSFLQKQLELQEEGGGSNRARFASVTSVGIDIRPKLVRELNRIVADVGIEGLRFEQGSIQDACLGDAAGGGGGAATTRTGEAGDSIQVFIALHACDTATDDALFSAIQRGADVIVTAPCCHKQLRPQINDLMLGGSSSKSRRSNPHPLADVLRHGIYRERTSETVTDALRATLLELAGYKTNVFEFVGGEHTAKNCMITGVRRTTRPSHANEQESIRSRIRSLADFYGIRHHKLADWMGEQSLMVPSGKKGDGDGDEGASPLPVRRSIVNMPPL
jgi:SAM-dependent methyltransferase